MTTPFDRAELRRVTSSILHYLDNKMRGMPEGCLVEVWAMSHPQVEGLERASRLSIPTGDGCVYSALQGEILDVLTVPRRHRHQFFRICGYNDASPKLLFTGDDCHLVHTTQAYTYIIGREDHLYRIPGSTSFVRDLHDKECFPLRPWSPGDRQVRGIFFATSCDASFVYGKTWDSLIEIDVANDIGRYRTIQSGWLQNISATILNGRSTLFWLDEFTTLTVSNDVGWLKTAWSPEATVWQVDLISEKVLAVFGEPAEPYDIRARPDGGLWATLEPCGDVGLVVEVWKPVFEFRANSQIMMRPATPIT
ncbi:hypothetical protein FOZ61_003221 [Perkinsus olseni]|uniref:Uncharacterized protein n=1 Tax=Perkinsus olseni TaxID=32597 RepID=A0A7J6MQT2_PEROL|nr:hypothetical protein FOZ61_003221 [Perkinsus olseni]KAF4673943.1 hypothetical protein FOL46_006136 [Perkinsus olseni]